MKIELRIEAGYKNGEQYKWNETFTEEAIKAGVDVAPSFRSEKLNHVPKVGERVFLGDDSQHHYPSDVIATRIS